MRFESHFLHMLLYSLLVSAFLAVLMRREAADRVRLGVTLWLAMVGGALGLAYIMFPFPR